MAKPFDEGGGWARQGRIHQTLLKKLKNDPYFALAAPKSTGRDWFHLTWLESNIHELGEIIQAVDVQRTLLELTAWSVAKAAVEGQAMKLWVCGGGANNEFLLEVLRHHLSIPVGTTQDLHIHPQQVEACAFAWLGYCFLRRQTASLPAVTGARKPKVLGALWPAS
jgi:anhydro-N-acetylmuramic acid kinase